MRIDRDLFGWGVFFAVAGGLALAIQEGVVADRAWWSFWPLILVGIGVGLLLQRTALEALGGLVVAATFGLMVPIGPRPSSARCSPSWRPTRSCARRATSWTSRTRSSAWSR